MERNLTIRKASTSEDSIIARHFYQLWLDNNVNPNFIDDDWLQITLEFILKARQELSFQAFVATIESLVLMIFRLKNHK